MAARDRGSGGEGGREPLSSLVHITDLWLTIIILAFCATAYYFTTTFDEVSPLLSENIPPEWFPRLLIWTIAILSLVLPFEHLFLEHGRQGLDAGRTARIEPMTYVTAGLLCLLVASIAWIGTLLTMILTCVALPVLWGERRWKVLVPYAILFPAVVAIVFTQLLKVYFQPGVLGLSLG